MSSPWLIKRGAWTQDTATAFAGYGTGNRTPALVRYKNESINRLVTSMLDLYHVLASCRNPYHMCPPPTYATSSLHALLSPHPTVHTMPNLRTSLPSPRFPHSYGQPRACPPPLLYRAIPFLSRLAPLPILCLSWE